MSWLLTVLNVLVNVVLIGLAAAVCFGLFRLFAKTSHPVTGDPGVAAALKKNANRWSTHRVAVAHVDLGGWPKTRMAFMGCDELTPFELGPATQALTGLLAADAIARRELSLSWRLGDLDERITGPLADQSVKALLTHTAGLPRLPRSQLVRNALLQWVFGLNPFSTGGPDLFKVASAQKLKAGYRDSPIGAALLGAALAARANTNFDELLQVRLLEPTGMVDTTTDPTRHKVKRGWRAFGRRSFPWRTSGYAPAIGAVSTLADLASLTHTLLKKNASGQKALQPLTGVPSSTRGKDSRQGMFWCVETLDPHQTGLSGKRQVAWQLGHSGGYCAFIAILPSAQRAVVVLSDTAVEALTQNLGLAVLHDLA